VCLIAGKNDCKIDGFQNGDLLPMCGVAKVMKFTGFIRLKTFCSLKIPTAKRQIKPPYSNDQKNFSKKMELNLKSNNGERERRKEREEYHRMPNKGDEGHSFSN
jgi:hypothetical protein